jgi:2,3-bisphosphoglycerate-dependent phosphoglycerate mutase
VTGVQTCALPISYYAAHIEPDVLAGKRVLVSAHGNSLRALIMKLEKLSPEQILKRELATGAPIVYRLDDKGEVIAHEDLAG